MAVSVDRDAETVQNSSGHDQATLVQTRIQIDHSRLTKGAPHSELLNTLERLYSVLEEDSRG